MKKTLAILMLAATLAVLPILSFAEEAFDPAGIIDWFNESYAWMTVANGHWSADPADQITDAELEQIFSMATKQQNAVHWTPWYFIVVKDVEEQRKIIGDYWGPAEDMATEGTVTVLVLADQILTADEGHISAYEGYYMPTASARYDSGLACGVLGVAAASLGYETHYFGTINGEYAPKDLANGKYQSMSRYVKDEYMRAWGFRSPYGGEIDPNYVYPVAGNCVFIDAIVIGKPKADETVESWGTNHARPANWVIWDGVPNEQPSPALSAAPVADEAPVAEEADEIALADNEFVGASKGFVEDVYVKITVADGKIAACEVVKHNESMGDAAIKAIPGAIVEAQSAEVDGVAGATFTSNAIKAAAAEAIAAAGL